MNRNDTAMHVVTACGIACCRTVTRHETVKKLQ